MYCCITITPSSLKTSHCNRLPHHVCRCFATSTCTTRGHCITHLQHPSDTSCSCADAVLQQPKHSMQWHALQGSWHQEGPAQGLQGQREPTDRCWGPRGASRLFGRVTRSCCCTCRLHDCLYVCLQLLARPAAIAQQWRNRCQHPSEAKRRVTQQMHVPRHRWVGVQRAGRCDGLSLATLLAGRCLPCNNILMT
jgi:hypothetical protein